MSMQDPISDMLTSIRNGQNAKKKHVVISFSKLKERILLVLQEEGFIKEYKSFQNVLKTRSFLHIYLKYYKGKKVIDTIQRISKPGLRVFLPKKKLPLINAGLGIAIISTSKGIMTDHSARKIGVGGEIICYVS